jgi:thymidylate synthase ThyX
MNVTQVAIRPSQASDQANRPALTPELLAASGARYSRNNEGLQSILSKIDPLHLEKSVDSIFRMVDYGHQSIADMVPVAMFMDGISMWLAYYIWTLCPTAGGQESSTRYIKISVDGLIAPETLGISDVAKWRTLMEECFDAYQFSVQMWETLAGANPSLMGIPQLLLDDPSDNARKKAARMKRNYAFDRARYFLPVAAATNVMLIMSARGWVNLCQFLLAQPLPEAQRLGELIRSELEIPAPRMLKHARRVEAVQQAIAAEFAKLAKQAFNSALTAPPIMEAPSPELNKKRRDKQSRAQAKLIREAQTQMWLLQDLAPKPPTTVGQPSAKPYLAVLRPDGVSPEEIDGDLVYHNNRYAPIGTSLQRTAVRFGWSAISFAEIRDLNRHRTGVKYCPQVPQGFYCAADQIPRANVENGAALRQLAATGERANEIALGLLRDKDPTYIYWTLLGTEYPFEHVTTADKFIYEAELRTGVGAHFRYAKHLRDALALFYKRFPSTKGLILEGSAEPE